MIVSRLDIGEIIVFRVLTYLTVEGTVVISYNSLLKTTGIEERKNAICCVAGKPKSQLLDVNLLTREKLSLVNRQLNLYRDSKTAWTISIDYIPFASILFTTRTTCKS